MTGDITHDYGASGTYQVAIRGDYPSINFGDDSDEGERYKLISIDQWGDIEWKSMEFSFRGCTNMTYMATDIPDLSQVTSLWGMFSNCSNFNGAIGDWDVSNVSIMSDMFSGATSFNQDIGLWNTSNVLGVNSM
ncbi:MAG TPA: BspA family leucine-rich repeat surface protein, partial [Saprospiraceae bacterium]|nr:BspA family leucine-rich repeat surface protein [Saprospiraceae bacterium]